MNTRWQKRYLHTTEEYLIILPKDIFARPQFSGARQLVLALSEGFDLFSLHGSSFSVPAACQLWPLTGLRM
jgi:hypothetical protein